MAVRRSCSRCACVLASTCECSAVQRSSLFFLPFFPPSLHPRLCLSSPQGINRTGNLLVPNSNYCLFEDFFTPVLNQMHDEQEKLVRSLPVNPCL